MKQPSSSAIYCNVFTVPESVVDQNGHVNNVVYVQWMQDVAIQHAYAVGGTRATQAAGATWVVHSHRIEYLKPAFAGEEIMAYTWVVNFRRVRSVRRYSFVRKKDNFLLAKGETEWVCVDAGTGRPRMIPSEVMHLFPLVTDDDAVCAQPIT